MIYLGIEHVNYILDFELKYTDKTDLYILELFYMARNVPVPIPKLFIHLLIMHRDIMFLYFSLILIEYVFIVIDNKKR